MTTAKDILISARKLIEKPEQWCHGEPMKNNQSCAALAIMRSVTEARSFHIDELCDEAIRLIGLAIGQPMCRVSLMVWNDRHSHAEVIAAFDRAIEMEGAAGFEPALLSASKADAIDHSATRPKGN